MKGVGLTLSTVLLVPLESPENSFFLATPLVLFLRVTKKLGDIALEATLDGGRTTRNT